MPGQRLRQYEVEEEIAEGGMAVVYKASDARLLRTVALKQLKPPVEPDPTLNERFLTEARLAAGINHPNVVTIHEFFVEQDAPYIAMEHFKLGTVKNLAGDLSAGQVLGVLLNVLEGLEAAQNMSVVHRDLKPENLLRTDQGTVKVGDFGIARTFGEERRTRDGMVQGTALYVAPEVAAGREANYVSDLYAVGVIGYELLTGDAPFHDTKGGDYAIIIRKYREDPVPLTLLMPDLYFGFASWVDRLLSRDPGRRSGSAAQAKEELTEVAARGNIVPLPLPVPGEPTHELDEETPPPPQSRFVKWSVLMGIASPRRLAIHSVTRPLFLLAVGCVIVGAVLDRSSLIAVGGVASLLLFALTFFDEKEARAAREVGARRSGPRGRHETERKLQEW